MYDVFSPVGRLSVSPALPRAQVLRLCADVDASWFPCDHGCCLLPGDLPDAVELRELVAELSGRHQVEGLVAYEEDEALVGIVVQEGAVSTGVLWRHRASCQALEEVIPLAPWRLRDAG